MAESDETPATPWKRVQAGRRARRNEEKGAKLSGGRRVSGSGAGREKGDIRTHGWRIEDKITEASSYRITEDDLDKITKAALTTPPGLLPQMRITLPHYVIRVLREEDALWLQTLADAYLEEHRLA